MSNLTVFFFHGPTNSRHAFREAAHVYDWVQSGSTQFFMDPDKTEANLHRAESRSRREEHHEGAKKLTQVRGGRRRRHSKESFWELLVVENHHLEVGGASGAKM